MKIWRNLLVLIVVFLIPFFFTACTKKESSAPVYKGIFQTLDNGQTWVARSDIANVLAKKITFLGIDVMNFIDDPQDPNTLYAATNAGLFYSYDYGKSWAQSIGMKNGKINDVAVDPKDSCTIYVSTGRYLYKSVDCGRHFKDIYREDSPKVEVGPILIDSFNPNIIYIGTSDGDVLKTVDGKNWETKARFKKPVLKLMHAKDTRIIVAGVYQLGAIFSLNGGDTWEEETIKVQRRDYKGATNVHDIAYDELTNTFFVVSDYGLLKTSDYGQNWEAIKLLTAPSSVHIWAVEVANAGKTIYYATSNNLFYSNNGGKTWLTKSLPTVNRVTNILLKYVKGKDLQGKEMENIDNPEAIIPSVMLSFRSLPKR